MIVKAFCSRNILVMVINIEQKCGGTGFLNTAEGSTMQMLEVFASYINERFCVY